MGRGGCAALLVLGTGCAQLFGIDPTTGGNGDAHPTAVSMQVQRITVGATVVRTPEDVSALTASYFVADPTDPSGIRRVPATTDGIAVDTWTAPIPDGTPPIEIKLGADYPDTFRRLYAFPQRTLKLLYGIYEDSGAVAPTPGSALDVKVTLPTAIATGEAFQLYSMGAWANHGFTAPELGASTTTIGPVSIAYDAATWASTSGRPLKSITMPDLVLALRYVTNYDLTGAAEFPQFAMTGGTDTIVTTMTGNPHAPLDVHLAPAATAARLAMPLPAGATVGMGWSVNASPGYEVANTTGPFLQHGDVLPADPGTITTPFGNPFTAHRWHSTFIWASNKSRTFAVPSLGNLVATLYDGINDVGEVAPALTFDDEAAIPILVSINQMPLTTDGKNLPLDATKAVELTLVSDTTNVLFYQWNIYEMRMNAAMTAIELHVAYVALSTEPKVTLPNDVFVAGKTYQLRAHCIKGGYPSFAEGNLWNRALPYSVGYLDAGVFTVSAL